MNEIKKVTDTMLKKRIGLGENAVQNTKFYNWKRREHLRDLIDLAKKGLLYEQIVTPDMQKKLEEQYVKY